MDIKGDYLVKTVTPMLSGQDLLEVLRPIVQEFFEHGDTKEVLVNISFSLVKVGMGGGLLSWYFL